MLTKIFHWVKLRNVILEGSLDPIVEFDTNKLRPSEVTETKMSPESTD